MTCEFIRGNFDSVVERSMNEVLADLVDLNKPNAPKFHVIKLHEDLNINDIIEKASNKKYESDIEVIEDLLKVICFIPTSQVYEVKDYDTMQRHYKFSYKMQSSFKDILNSIKIRKEEKKWITAWTLFDTEWKSYFKKMSISFYSKEEEDILTIFQDFDYPLIEMINSTVLQLFLNHVKETITAQDENLFTYALKWYASVIQNPGTKTEAAIVIKGMQGWGRIFPLTCYVNLLVAMLRAT
jgi:hypothetical protein